MCFKNKISLFLTGFAVLILLGSCRKFLEQEPTNRLSIDDIFMDFEGARTTLVGLYGNLKDVNYYERTLFLYPDLTGGNIKYARNNPTILVNTYNFSNTNQISFNEMTTFYRIGYNNIYRANNILTNINQAANASTLQKNRMLADAYTFRALAHFDLVRVFAQPYNFSANGGHSGIVIRTQNTLGTDPVEPAATVGAVYQQIMVDLDSALLLYPNSVPIYLGGSDKTWLSADAAKAIKLRVLLYMENWQGVVDIADQLITNNYPLMSNAGYENSWRRSASNSMDNEAIFMLFARIDQNQASYGDNFNPGNTTFGYMAASNDLLNLFAPGDVRGRGSMFFTQTVSNQDFQFTRKYQGRNDSANNQKLIRISEIIISRAEAYAELENLTAAQTDLNRIRQRGNPSTPSLALTNKQQVLDSIFVERRRELCFEGHTLFDFTRKKRNLIRQDCLGSNCSLNYPDPRFAVPIPNQR